MDTLNLPSGGAWWSPHTAKGPRVWHNLPKWHWFTEGETLAACGGKAVRGDRFQDEAPPELKQCVNCARWLNPRIMRNV